MGAGGNFRICLPDCATTAIAHHTNNAAQKTPPSNFETR